MKKSFFCKKNNEAQLLLIGGVIIAFLIIAMSSISISISDINKPVHKTDFIRQNYANIREEFGRTLNDTLENVSGDIENNTTDKNTIFMPNFNYTKQMYIFVAKSNGNNFNVDNPELIFPDGDDSNLTGVNVKLSFGNEKEFITE